MVKKPTISRARIWADLQAHPRGMTANQVLQYTLRTRATAAEVREVLEEMARDGLIRRGLQPRPTRHDPLVVYFARDLPAGAKKPPGGPRQKVPPGGIGSEPC